MLSCQIPQVRCSLRFASCLCHSNSKLNRSPRNSSCLSVISALFGFILGFKAFTTLDSCSHSCLAPENFLYLWPTQLNILFYFILLFHFTLKWILSNLLKFIYFIYFIFGCVGSSLLHVGFALVAASGGYSSMRCTGFSLWWLLLLWSTGSRHAGFSSCGSWALEHRLSSCGTWA